VLSRSNLRSLVEVSHHRHPWWSAKRSTLLLFVSASLSFFGIEVAVAQPLPAPPADGTNGDAILKYYPAEELAAGLSGSATVKCGRTKHGGFEHCQVVSESPPNSGFAAASLAIAARAVEGCDTLTDQQRAPKDLTFTFAASPLSIVPNVLKRGWMIEELPWRRKPDSDEIFLAYPKHGHGAGGATLVCRADSQGELADCKIKEESPLGQGFGLAALSLAQAFAIKTATCDGRSTEGAVVIVPIRWSGGPG